MYAMAPIMEPLLEVMTYPLLIATASVQLQVILMLDCTFLFIHLCYYIVAQYLRVLSSELSIHWQHNEG